MIRRAVFVITSLVALAACAPPPPSVGADGQSLPQVYKIKNSDTAKIQFRVLDSINALRSGAGQAPLELNSQLTAAAATHSRDMSVQNRPWHFGSDGSSPLDRVARAGYTGKLIGENISETYEDETTTLSAWMDLPRTPDVILDPDARNLGFSWFQEETGKIWWTLITGT
ncbi:MAG: CAP domain-containing protein [Litoreibacter sp.]|nr:CAP domain-containing protein [Litoreibacter sp.]MCY4336202.1 CAP domain-containing protein [Litoreibacter sp.]